MSLAVAVVGEAFEVAQMPCAFDAFVRVAEFDFDVVGGEHFKYALDADAVVVELDGGMSHGFLLLCVCLMVLIYGDIKSPI